LVKVVSKSSEIFLHLIAVLALLLKYKASRWIVGLSLSILVLIYLLEGDFLCLIGVEMVGCQPKARVN